MGGKLTQLDVLKPRAVFGTVDGIIVRVANRYGGSKAKELERFLKFSVVGISGAIVDFGMLFLMQATLLPPKSPLHVALATTIAFLSAVLNNFIWNRYWVYPDSRSRTIRRQLTQFTIINFIGWVARTTWITLAYLPIGNFLMPYALPFIHILRPTYIPSEHAAAKLGTVVAQMIGMAVVMVWNFAANRYWTYNDVD
jgi:putative flippase GtrA